MKYKVSDYPIKINKNVNPLTAESRHYDFIGLGQVKWMGWDFEMIFVFTFFSYNCEGFIFNRLKMWAPQQQQTGRRKISGFQDCSWTVVIILGSYILLCLPKERCSG